MSKYSLINEVGNFEEGDQIIFEMPPFCSGEYGAIVKRDSNFGLYIDEDNNYFKGCIDYEIVKQKINYENTRT